MFERLRELGRLAGFGGWTFTDAMFLAARVEVDPRAMRRHLPRGLSLARPARATVFVAHYPSTSFGSVYSEAGVFVDVRRHFRRAAHCPWMLVDDDVALILGRELLGYPKKMGSIRLDLDGDTVSARVERRGVELLSMSGKLGGRDDSPPPMLGRRFQNAWGPLGWGWPRLVSFAPREKILEARSVALQLAIHEAPRDPLHELGLGAIADARLYRVNIGGGGPPWPGARIGPWYALKNLALRYR